MAPRGHRAAGRVSCRTIRNLAAALGVAAAASSVLLTACGDDATDVTVTDAGLIDSFPADAALPTSDAAATGHGARLTLVNAAHDLGPNAGSGVGNNGTLRLCFEQGASLGALRVAPYRPLPDDVMKGSATGLPGLDQGRGATLPAIGVSFADQILVPVLMSAHSLRVNGLDDVGGTKLGTRCDELLDVSRGSNLGLAENVDYWVLAPIYAGTLEDDRAYVVVLTGCAGSATTINPGKCGAGFVAGRGPGSGNLALTVHETTKEPVALPFGAQFVHASTQANAFLSTMDAKSYIRPGFVADGRDGGGYRAISDVDPPLLGFHAATAVPDEQATDAFVFGPRSSVLAESQTGLPLYPFPLAAVAMASDGESVSYLPGRNYVFLAVGDPDGIETPPIFMSDVGVKVNLRAFHFLAFPSDPVAPPYQPR